MKLTLTFVVVLLMACVCVCVQPTASKFHKVGGAEGWGPDYDYNSWAKSKTFKKGDVLLFQYTEGYGVQEVRAMDLKKCDGSKALYDANDGNTSIPLRTVGTHFFIFSDFDMCSQGMNMTIKVV